MKLTLTSIFGRFVFDVVLPIDARRCTKLVASKHCRAMEHAAPVYVERRETLIILFQKIDGIVGQELVW